MRTVDRDKLYNRLIKWNRLYKKNCLTFVRDNLLTRLFFFSISPLFSFSSSCRYLHLMCHNATSRHHFLRPATLLVHQQSLNYLQRNSISVRLSWFHSIIPRTCNWLMKSLLSLRLSLIKASSRPPHQLHCLHLQRSVKLNSIVHFS